jgi:hypothetical protein
VVGREHLQLGAAAERIDVRLDRRRERLRPARRVDDERAAARDELLELRLGGRVELELAGAR